MILRNAKVKCERDTLGNTRMLRNVKVNLEILESLKRASQDFRVPKKEVKPMEQIRTIYREVFSKSPAAIGADQKLTEEIEQEIEERKRRAGQALTEEEWTDLVFAGSSYGQIQGFESGFQYAMALIAESLCN